MRERKLGVALVSGKYLHIDIAEKMALGTLTEKALKLGAGAREKVEDSTDNVSRRNRVISQ